MNYLEELVAEWYEYRGYFVRRNVNVGRRARGGYQCELDVVAFHPETRHLVHVEPSMDASSWAVRDRRFRKKFEAGSEHIPRLFRGMDLPAEIEQIALLCFASRKNRTKVGGGTLMLVEDLLAEVATALKDQRLASDAVPEDKPLLRSFQFVIEYFESFSRALSGRNAPMRGDSCVG